MKDPKALSGSCFVSKYSCLMVYSRGVQDMAHRAISSDPGVAHRSQCNSQAACGMVPCAAHTTSRTSEAHVLEQQSGHYVQLSCT